MATGTETKKKPGKKRKRRFLLLLAIILLSILGYYGYHLYSFANKIQSIPTEGSTEEWTGGRVNILLLGEDARPGEGHTRSDSMILLSMDPTTHKGSLFSVMRDTWWKIPGSGYDKINAANALGGPQKAAQAVSNFLDIPIHYYVETNFVGFTKIVDTLGGVDINVDQNMEYDDPTDGTHIHLRKGMQHLDGAQALNFVRFRHDALGDYNRTARQRTFLQALAAKGKSSIALFKLPQILDEMSTSVETNMSTSDMLKIGQLLYGINLADIQTEQVPRTNDLLEQYLPDGGDVLIPHVLATRQFVHQALGMNDNVVSTAAEEYYWNQYYGRVPAALNGGQVTSNSTNGNVEAQKKPDASNVNANNKNNNQKSKTDPLNVRNSSDGNSTVGNTPSGKTSTAINSKTGTGDSGTTTGHDTPTSVTGGTNNKSGQNLNTNQAGNSGGTVAPTTK
ncbi:LCP family protein [Effusibacillus dendaii]|uniref:Cell envelope-related transcriptional attenuator n=1 Tax=Effusibacillus dendaii TaxID=2743772 RepID=A0A7I8D6C2_9BACL|nr:LCP family protein [Effusibacillus dendaii]BCJ85635.1 cell envelope-related transcriptional attenuator [Effusibacillus dendaii]